MITRRTILQSAGTAAVLSAAPWEQLLAGYFEEARTVPYSPESIVTSCGICDSACGIRA